MVPPLLSGRWILRAEFVETWALLASSLMGGVLVLSAEAGSRPGGRGTCSLLRQRKVPKRKATPSLRPLRGAKGQTCGVSVAGCAVELALRCARRSDSHGESVHEARALRRACHPATAPPQAQPAGVGPRTALRAIAALALAFAARGACGLETGAERSAAKQWPVWMSAPPGSLLDAPGARRARGGMRVGARMLRALTHRSCLSGAPKARSEFCGAHRDRAPQVAP